jgi:hypothetical protein
MYLAGMGTYMMYKSKSVLASIIGGGAGVLLIYILLSGQMNYIQFAVAILPAFLSTIPLYLSLFTKKEEMVYIADRAYHQIAMLFFFLCILIILF